MVNTVSTDQTCTVYEKTYKRLHTTEQEARIHGIQISIKLNIRRTSIYVLGASESPFNGNDYISKIDSTSNVIDQIHTLMIKM